ncbi:MAG: hypothetical protein MJ162_02330 [Treponema sp.]|nr:hypothetical protein [Treponema sp.]
MKKLLSLSVAALALAATLLTGCASSGGAKKDAGAGSVHPRSYVLDPIDGGEVWEMPYNQYGPNYQSLKERSHYPLVKTDKPQAGDTIEIRSKFTSDIDIPMLFAHVTDQSAQANYWTILGEVCVLVAEDIKAGVPVEWNYDYVLEKPVKGDFTLCFVYDQDAKENPLMEGVAKVGAKATLTFERVAESTDTANETPAAPHVAVRDVAIEKYAAFFEVATNHPWINGQQDMSVISNYEGYCDLANLYGEDLPKAGDTLNVTWKAKSDIDIAKLNIRLVDRSPAANWWKEIDSNAGSGAVLIENVVGGETFEASIQLTYGEDAVGGSSLVIWYDVGEGDGPAIILMSRD